ncbi:MAG TPA: bifunctional (p)ppGpp synthetase/guanosine-3',5'-bis(diphosphate) 3'-pyrophosphohydrolase [Pelagibacteraceae bacterium]|jgi:RelA/SpoT family (p)ppGpp synthetase|nr:bifunctional (p)ppGpp synthetase/guanosine-3',5'-bis(diphosphate) 3'-pyrophosphohydrolase [Pelagibacteraceae bacterium]
MLNQKELIEKVKNYNRFFNSDALSKAYTFALDAHKDQKRDSGDPYLIHPVAVADILTDLKLDSATIATGLLHDTIEDTKITYETVKKEFGKEVADLVEGVSKISELEGKVIENSKAENIRKLILATSKDIRVLLVKLADRLHNMRTLNSISDENRRKRIAKETMEIYAPLSDRMGMNHIRDELEDLSFQKLNPDARNLVVERLSINKKNRENSFKEISKNFTKILKNSGVNAKIVGREKTPFSIWKKMQSKRVSLEQLTDIIGFRVIVKDVVTCYKVLGVFHSNWSTIPGRFKDYISTPKINNYKSIHTAVIGPNKERVAIQIRTQQMQEFAERGIASHWIYKSSEKVSHLALKEYDWLRDLVEIMEKDTNPEHFLEYTKLQMFQDNVFCFTPKGEVIKLPIGASPIDFAYAVHTKIGDSLSSCEINGRGSPLQSVLKNGDLVNIIGTKNGSPSLEWLSYAKTGKARAAIRRYWQLKKNVKQNSEKKYISSLCIKIPNLPGKLGEVSSLIGFHENNIINMEIISKKTDYLEFIFDIQIRELKNYKNLISELKLKEYKFRIIRHRKKDAFLQRIFKNFKRN